MTATSQSSRLTPALRYVLALLAISIFINYIDRSNLSIAAPLLKDELSLSASQLGILLSAFFWTYSGCQLLAGWLVDRFDVKYVFAIGFFLWSSATAATGLLHGFVALVAMRVILGAGESVAYPSYSKIIATHLPEYRRGFANALIASGLCLGPAVGLLFGADLVARFGWRPFFLGLGLIGLLWLPPWFAFMPSTPVKAEAGERQEFVIILRQRSLWGTCVCLFCHNYFSYFMLTWLPFYLVRERGYSLTQMARIAGAFLILAAIIASLSGWLSDHWIAAGASHTRVRKSLLVGSALLIGLFSACFVFVPKHLCILFLLLTGLPYGAANANIWVVTQRLAGVQAVGRWSGIQLFVGNLAGVVAPAITGYLVDRTGHFQWPFLVTTAIVWIGSLSWLFLVGPVEPIVWLPIASQSSALHPAPGQL
jgi:MFS transporter, ACS family, D-galactonate transporter